MSFFSQIKQVLVGKTLPTSAHAEERLNNATALAVLASDALSSVAYATEETLLVLIAAFSTAGSGVFGYSLPIAIAIVVLLGITYLTNVYHIAPDLAELGGRETVISKLSHEILGNGIPYYFVIYAALLILLLAANTSFADFPRLCYFLARDGFLPRQLALLGDRLVYSNGIILLSLSAAILVVIFQGNVSAIIPLYAVGVFTSFTLSQARMVRRWFQEKTSGWQASALMNGFGAMATLVVLGVIVWTKFALGAWAVVVAIPVVVSFFLAIHRHYQYVAERLTIEGVPPRSYIPRPKTAVVNHPTVVVVGQLNRGTLEALDYARSIADEIVAVHVDIGTTDREQLQQKWQELEADIPLMILDSPYRSVVSPIVNFIREFEARNAGVLSTVIIPAFVPRNWWKVFYTIKQLCF